MPVTIKFRMGVDDGTSPSSTTGRIAEDEGAAAVALHARTAEQLYAGEADWDAIAALKAARSTSIPVLGNGDIWEAADALRDDGETGCDGVVVGPGLPGPAVAVPRPRRRLRRGPPDRPRRLRRHRGAAARATPGCWSTGRATATSASCARHAAWYVKGYPVGGDVRRRLTAVATLAELEQVLAEVVAEVGADLALPAEGEAHRTGPHEWPTCGGAAPRLVRPGRRPHPPAGADTLVSGG